VNPNYIHYRNPVLLAVDDLQAIYRERTVYRDPHFAHIRPYHLSMSRLLLDFTSGKRTFANGAVLGAVTSSDSQFPIPNELLTSLEMSRYHAWSPYDKTNKILMEYAKGLQNLEVPNKFTLKEATSVFEVWMKDRSLSARMYHHVFIYFFSIGCVDMAVFFFFYSAANDESFLAKYTESGGHPRTFVWKGILSTLEGAGPEPDVTTPWPHLREMSV
jgi:small subunit ribosomal protein S29